MDGRKGGREDETMGGKKGRRKKDGKKGRIDR